MTMRTLWMFMAAAALTSTACTKEVIDNDYNPTDTEGRRVQFTISEVEGRTAFGESTDGETYPTLWKDGDNIKISSSLDVSNRSFLKDPDTGNSPKVTAYNNGKNASFAITVPEQASGVYNFYALCPASMWTHTQDRAGGLLRVEIPSTQTSTATSCDPLGQLLVATATTNVLPESLPLQFSHVAAYGLFSISGLPANETVASVKLTSSKVISGRFFYDMDDAIVDITTSSSGLSKTITVTTSSKDVWFAAIPADLSNTTLKVEVTTSLGTYVKDLTLGSNRKLQSGHIAKMTVDLSDATFTVHQDAKVGHVWYEGGKPVGIVYWVSADGNTAKVMHLERSQKMVWCDPYTSLTTATGNPAIESSHTNTEDLKQWAIDNPSVSFPALDYLDELNKSGDNWYWPTRNDMATIAKVYYNTSSLLEQNKETLRTEAPEQYAATQAFEALLSAIETKFAVNTDPLDDAAENTNGTTYWTSCDVGKNDQAWVARIGKYKGYGSAKKNTYYVRAVKTITNVLGYDVEKSLRAASWSSQTLREGVKVHSASLSLFDRPQQIYVTEITPSATNQIGIYHAGADTPKQVATQATAAGALAAVNGGFFPMAGATPKTGFVRINGVDKEQGDDELNSTFAGGALVINGTTPGIIKVAGNEAARELEDENVLVCGPLLLLNGATQTLSATSDHTTSYAQRTVVGVTENGTFLMVTIHGRDGSITGMNGLELQKLMRGLRAKDALNLDGGGSTALWANGGYVYSTSRSVANIVYVKK